MGSPTCLTDPDALVVIDTSAVINLIATCLASEILRALPQRVLAVDAVQMELGSAQGRGRQNADILKELVNARFIEIVTLSNFSVQTFEGLVIGPATATLDDGEAATIAYSVEHSGVAILDERKANRICGEKFPALRIGATVDLLAHPRVISLIGRNHLSKAVVNALRFARMRVLPQHLNWVIDLIGPQQAAQCPSLPRHARIHRGSHRV